MCHPRKTLSLLTFVDDTVGVDGGVFKPAFTARKIAYRRRVSIDARCYAPVCRPLIIPKRLRRISSAVEGCRPLAALSRPALEFSDLRKNLATRAIFHGKGRKYCSETSPENGVGSAWKWLIQARAVNWAIRCSKACVDRCC